MTSRTVPSWPRGRRTVRTRRRGRKTRTRRRSAAARRTRTSQSITTSPRVRSDGSTFFLFDNSFVLVCNRSFVPVPICFVPQRMVCSCTSVTCSVTVSVVTPPFCPGLQGKCAVQSFDTDTQSLCAMIENIMGAAVALHAPGACPVLLERLGSVAVAGGVARGRCGH